jgi:hypothetical protein
MYKKICILLLAFMLTACSNASKSDSQAETEAVSETTTTTVTTTDDSEQPTTTTTQITVTSAKEKESKTTTSKVTSGSTTGTSESTAAAVTKAAATTTRSTTIKTVQTSKTTAKSTSKTTAKATAKSAQTKTDLSKLTPYWRALYKMTHGTATRADYEIVRNEMLAYGKKLYPKVPINTKMHPLITKDGRYTDSFTEAQGGTNSNAEYYTVVPFGNVGIKSNYASEDARWAEIRTFDTNFKAVIRNTLKDNERFGDVPTIWYISYGFENYGNGTGYYTWVCMTAFPEDWK